MSPSAPTPKGLRKFTQSLRDRTDGWKQSGGGEYPTPGYSTESLRDRRRAMHCSGEISHPSYIKRRRSKGIMRLYSYLKQGEIRWGIEREGSLVDFRLGE